MTLMNSGKCPKCDASVQMVKVEQITSKPIPGNQRHEGVSYLCPLCNTVLGVNMAPITLQQEALES